jgi:hypothetical protein
MAGGLRQVLFQLFAAGAGVGNGGGGLVRMHGGFGTGWPVEAPSMRASAQIDQSSQIAGILSK